MTIRQPYFIIAAFFVLLLSVCCNKNRDANDPAQEVTILISTGSQTSATRAPAGYIDPTDAGRHPDYRIGTLRVLLYHESNYQLYMNTGMFTPPDDPQDIKILTGRYVFVFIANEHLDAALSAGLDGLALGSPFSALDELKIAASAFDCKSTGTTPVTGELDTFIPKIAVKGNVLVSKRGDKVRIEESDGTVVEDNTTEKWVVPVTQSGIRIDLTMSLTANQWDLYDAGDLEIYFENIPDYTYLLGLHNDDAPKGNIVRTLQLGEAYTKSVAATGGTDVRWFRIILPETFFADKSNQIKGIRLCAKFGSEEPKKATIGTDLLSEPKNYVLRQGTLLWIRSASIDEDGIKIEGVTVEEWDGVEDVDIEL